VPLALLPSSVRVRTWYSGVSAGTELTAYRGSNPYLTRTWDAGRRLFVEGEPTFAYPIEGWGYSEVGEVVEVAVGVTRPVLGDVVHGIWGHRSEAVLPAAAVAERVWTGDPVSGTFARVGAIALNALLAADVRLGDRVAVFGQGVIGLLATRLAVLAGAEVAAVDALESRLDAATAFGAAHVVRADVPGGAGAAVRAWSNGGVDSAIELSGNDRALHEAVRAVVVDGTVAASGFYQGGAVHLRLGEEFHHNRVRVVASQISGTPVALGRRWDQPRLVRTFLDQVRRGRVDAGSLVTDVVDAADVAAVFARLDRGDPAILQAVLRFPAAPEDR
jgi:threonine dehydrogenase-like Zn-dependent dehydrogenase